MDEYLSSRNIRRIDAVVVSHADHDHYSGLFGLFEQYPVGTLFVSQPFLDFEQRGIVDLCDTAARQEIPIRIVQQGDTLSAQTENEASIGITVLHPKNGFDSDSDNANSIVLQIEYQQRRILLTGDVEDDGLDVLLADPVAPVDVLLSPHHGSARSNPLSLLAWARPHRLIVSTNDREVGTRLRSDVPVDIDVLTTIESGAVSVTIDQSGHLEVSEHLKRHASASP